MFYNFLNIARAKDFPNDVFGSHFPEI
uniref:Uncharacterized protein n=1 Tax=Moniliophthora roreri TaxID=221103 RepID=A0A0W0FI57_MONRR